MVDEKPPATTSYPTADQLIAKYVDALGGERALRAVTSRVITATGDVPSGPRNEPRVSARIETYQKAPNLALTITRMPNGAVSTGFDGQSAWMQNPNGSVTQFTGLELNRARRDANFYQPLDLKTTYLRFVVGGIEPVNNRDAYILIAAPRGGDSPERLYFDTQTGLLLRRQTVVPTPFGNSPTNVDYEQYRDAGDGTKYPFLIRTTTVTQRYVVRVERVQNNAPIENTRFAPPPRVLRLRPRRDSASLAGAARLRQAAPGSGRSRCGAMRGLRSAGRCGGNRRRTACGGSFRGKQICGSQCRTR